MLLSIFRGSESERLPARTSARPAPRGRRNGPERHTRIWEAWRYFVVSEVGWDALRVREATTARFASTTVPGVYRPRLYFFVGSPIGFEKSAQPIFLNSSPV